MKRRTFIKALLTNMLTAIAVVTLPALRASASLNPSQGFLSSKNLGRSFQGTVDGRLLESLDNGRTWQQVFDFGKEVSVLGLVERQGSLFLEMGVQQYTFYLQSKDGRLWLTTPSIPAV